VVVGNAVAKGSVDLRGGAVDIDGDDGLPEMERVNVIQCRAEFVLENQTISYRVVAIGRWEPADAVGGDGRAQGNGKRAV
jgi:hypothetical protein